MSDKEDDDTLVLIKLKKTSELLKNNTLEIFTPKNEISTKTFYNKSIDHHLIFCDYCGCELEESTILFITDADERIWGAICERCLSYSNLRLPIKIEQLSMNEKIRLEGALPKPHIRVIDLDPDKKIAEIKKQLNTEYKLRPDYSILLLWDGKVLPEDYTLARIGINPEIDMITLMMVREVIK